MAVFAAAHRLETLVWIGILITSLVRFIAFGVQDHLPQKKRIMNLASGMILSTYSFIVIWAAQQQVEDRIDFWIAEASLAMLVLWLVKNGKTIPRLASPERNHTQKWKQWGLPVISLLLFVGMPLLIPPLMTKGVAVAQLPFTRFSLLSLPIISPAFWALLIGVWVVNKFHWLEITNKTHHNDVASLAEKTPAHS